MSNKEPFLDELKKQYDKEFELKNNLETKANYLLTSSGIIIGLLFSFGATILGKPNSSFYFSLTIGLLLGDIIVFIVAIIFSANATKITRYRYSALHKNFYNDDGTFDEEFKNQYKTMSNEKFLNDRIDEYLACNRQNFDKNEGKAKSIKITQILFSCGVGIVPFTILFYTLSTILN